MINSQSKIAAATWVVLILCGVFFAGVGKAQSITPLELDPARVQWTHLVFEGKKALGRVRIEVDLNSINATEAEKAFIDSPRGEPVRPAASEVYYLQINRFIKIALRKGASLRDRVWFNPKNAAAYQRIRLRLGNNETRKRYRYTQQGIFRLRNEPKDNREISLGPGKWTDIRENFYSFDISGAPCCNVSDPAVLLYLLSVASTMPKNDSIPLCVFGKKEVHYLRLRSEGIQTLDIHYREKILQAEKSREGKVNALKIVLESLPGPAGADNGEVFSFLELKQNIAFYIDPIARIPIRVSGSILIIGQTDLNLREVVLRQE